MKPIIILPLFVCLISCKHDDLKPSAASIIGTWKWTATSGGLMPSITPANQGYTMTLILGADLRYTTYKNEIITKTGSYTTKTISTTDFIYFDSDPGLMINQPSFNVLELGDDAADGPKYHYQRAEGKSLF